jgi:hypothetical protein
MIEPISDVSKASGRSYVHMRKPGTRELVG